ncbi:hypothetical protein H010_00560 [Hydrogenophaga taeniospiralis CCUG 15921]|uniref:Uncharacterized protein n=1 Tax=Hydrogenophaga taeniospiralis CCUG 15921 TaxID=1281780 RepID=A0A9X4NPT5_9BURK|nr:hypothetical protein [Hydrogenophaga taeniospiralis]MDG5973719.1 hypothetical protein [Hydrogenophaga taeniospiralis CCUG 15921]
MESEFHFDREPVQALLIAQHREQLESLVARGMITSNEAALLAAHYSVGDALQRAVDATCAMMAQQVAEKVH